MNIKKVAIGTRPTRKIALTADSWVENQTENEPMKRLTIDIPESLHRAIKIQCSSRGSKIADEVRGLLLKKYGKS